MLRISLAFVAVVLSLVLFADGVFAQDMMMQKINEIDLRVGALEEFADNLQSSLDSFSEDLLDNVDWRMKLNSGSIAVLDPVSKGFSRVVTNSGVFLVSIQKREKLDNGYRLYINIGNPNVSLFSGVVLNIRWGKKWNSELVNPTYKEWRESLQGGEYQYPGGLPPGEWTEIILDIIPAEAAQIEHIECEMTVSSVQLKAANSQ